MNTLELVRKYEPALYFSKDTEGREETFFPMAVEHFVAESRLYQNGQSNPIELAGGLNLETLGQISPRKSQHTYLTYVADRTISDEAGWREWFEHKGLQRGLDEEVPEDEQIGDGDTDADTAFGIGAFVRDSVTETQRLPPEITTASLETYRRYTDFSRYPPIYYYRVMNQRGFTVIQYWYFYAFNDWGTAHDGMNDHEGDWEMVYLFLEGDQPAYVAYAAHFGVIPYAWAEVELVEETHPVVYVACGSHGSYPHKGTHDIAKLLKDRAEGDSATRFGPSTPVPWGSPVDLASQPWALNFAGHWGTVFTRLGTDIISTGVQGPLGPAWQFERWETPVNVADVAIVND